MFIDTTVYTAERSSYVVDDDATINAEGYAIEDENGDAIVSEAAEPEMSTDYSDTGYETSEDDY